MRTSAAYDAAITAQNAAGNNYTRALAHQRSLQDSFNACLSNPSATSCDQLARDLNAAKYQALDAKFSFEIARDITQTAQRNKSSANAALNSAKSAYNHCMNNDNSYCGKWSKIISACADTVTILTALVPIPHVQVVSKAADKIGKGNFLITVIACTRDASTAISAAALFITQRADTDLLIRATAAENLLNIALDYAGLTAQ